MASIYQQYYTKSDEITKYMINKLSIKPRSLILEPCAGDGVFAVNFYKTNKKSRFQNSHYYFKQGVAVPMVSSNAVTASLINNRIFDQSIVGIFPKNNDHILFLLGFFNTSICTRLLKMINPSANNSANYIKKIPIIIPDVNTILHINELVETALMAKNFDDDTFYIENELNDIFNVLYYEDKEKNIIKNKQQELFAL